MRRSLFTLIAIFAASIAQSQDFLSSSGPKDPIRINQRLNQQIPLDLEFLDESGARVTLGDYFGRKPVVLSLVYFRCPMLCNIVLDGLTASLANIRLDMGEAYEVISVSFDPRDTPAAAREKKEIFTRRYGRPGAESAWHFLTGDQRTIRELTNAVGFHYEWDEKSGQFAHGSGIVVLTPEGKIARYFYGIDYPARDLRLALVEASSGKIGSLTDQILLLCFHYDPATGKYSRIAMNVVRAGGVVTLLGIAGFAFVMVRRDRRSAGQTERDRYDGQ
ncbi:MAG TPA: SCO family protein [Thermoanaerobaculia bacterium]|nr:SCO family protein [Thermoanaerobaculia bacterium]